MKIDKFVLLTKRNRWRATWWISPAKGYASKCSGKAYRPMLFQHATYDYKPQWI